MTGNEDFDSTAAQNWKDKGLRDDNRSAFELAESGAFKALRDTIQFHLDGLFSSGSIALRRVSAWRLAELCATNEQAVALFRHDGTSATLLRVVGLLSTERDSSIRLSLVTLALVLVRDDAGRIDEQLDLPANVFTALLEGALEIEPRQIRQSSTNGAFVHKSQTNTGNSDDLSGVASGTKSGPSGLLSQSIHRKRKFGGKRTLDDPPGKSQKAKDVASNRDADTAAATLSTDAPYDTSSCPSPMKEDSRSSSYEQNREETSPVRDTGGSSSSSESFKGDDDNILKILWRRFPVLMKHAVDTRDAAFISISTGLPSISVDGGARPQGPTLPLDITCSLLSLMLVSRFLVVRTQKVTAIASIYNDGDVPASGGASDGDDGKAVGHAGMSVNDYQRILRSVVPVPTSSATVSASQESAAVVPVTKATAVSCKVDGRDGSVRIGDGGAVPAT